MVQAQRYEIGINGVATGYMGDLNVENPLYFGNVGGGLFFKYNFNPMWGLKFSANHLLISGDDRDFDNEFQQVRNLKFSNQLTELGLNVEFNFWGLMDIKRSLNFTPYIATGLALIKHDPYIYYEDTKVKLRTLQLEYDANSNSTVYNNLNLAVPIVLGIKYKINSTWSLGLEANYRFAFTDYLDNVSQYYPTSVPSTVNYPNIIINSTNPPRQFDSNDWKYLADPSNNLNSNAGRARGDGQNRDGYFTAGITLTYNIFDLSCYSWIKR